MNLGNKAFKNIQTGEIVRIKDSYQNIAITETNERIDANRLLDNRFYTEYIDPKSFFTNDATYNLFAEKIKNVDLSKIPEDDSNININLPSNNTLLPSTNESAVVMYDEEEERAELIRKYGAVDNSNMRHQQEAFAKILAEPDEVVQVNVDRNPVQNYPVSQTKEEVIQRINVEDPIITMFRNAKKNVDFSFQLKVEGKIPRLDFIEMMEDSYEVSMIEFLAEEFTNALLKNPEELKNKIVDEIKRRVYPNKKEEKVQKQEEVIPIGETTIESKPKPTRGRKPKEVK